MDEWNEKRRREGEIKGRGRNEGGKDKERKRDEMR